MTHKSINVTLTLLILVVLSAIFWTLGQRYGARQALEVSARQLSSAEAQSLIDSLQTELVATKTELEAAKSLAQTNSARAQVLTDQLQADLLQDSVDAQDLALYRKIEKSDKPQSIGIKTLKIGNGVPALLEVTLIQWQGRDRVSGELKVSLEFTSPAGVAKEADDISVEKAKTPVLANKLKNGPIQMDLAPVPFSFRFFQKLTVTLPGDTLQNSPDNTQPVTPDAIVLRITQADGPLEPTEARFLWDDIEE